MGSSLGRGFGRPSFRRPFVETAARDDPSRAAWAFGMAPAEEDLRRGLPALRGLCLLGGDAPSRDLRPLHASVAIPNFDLAVSRFVDAGR